MLEATAEELVMATDVTPIYTLTMETNCDKMKFKSLDIEPMMIVIYSK